MKAKLVYWNQFFIPSILPHAFSQDTPYCDICGDTIAEENSKLILETNCGRTTFPDYQKVQGGWLVLSNPDLAKATNAPYAIQAEYEGAWAALNACVGVIFPGCQITNIISTLGHFPDEWSYETIRQALGFHSEEGQQRALNRLHIVQETSTIAPSAQHRIDRIKNELPVTEELLENSGLTPEILQQLRYKHNEET